MTFPATRVHVDGYVGPQVIMPSSLAKRLSFDSVPVGVLVPSAHGFTVAEQQKLALALTATGRSLQVTYETGFRDGRSWIWVTLIGAAAFVAVFAALIATALANIDGRADLLTLGAVGASPRTRRVLSMSRAAVIAGLGALTGTAAGLLPAAAWVRAINAPVVLPWPALVLTVLGVPLVTALLAGAFTSTRSRT